MVRKIRYVIIYSRVTEFTLPTQFKIMQAVMSVTKRFILSEILLEWALNLRNFFDMLAHKLGNSVFFFTAEFGKLVDFRAAFLYFLKFTHFLFPVLPQLRTNFVLWR